MPIIILFNSLPKIALAPLFLMWFGYGMIPNILVATMIAFFPVVINTTTGLNEVENDLLDLVHYLNASKLQVFLKIRIPNSLPYIFAGFKIAATMCVVGAIVGEFIASSKGLGYLLRDAQAFINTPPMFACFYALDSGCFSYGHWCPGKIYAVNFTEGGSGAMKRLTRAAGTPSLVKWLEMIKDHYQTVLVVLGFFLSQVWSGSCGANFILPTPSSAAYLFPAQPDANYNWRLHIHDGL